VKEINLKMIEELQFGKYGIGGWSRPVLTRCQSNSAPGSVKSDLCAAAVNELALNT